MVFSVVAAWRTGCFDPKEPFLRLWNGIFFILSIVALCVDILLLYDLGIDNHRKCLLLDVNLERRLAILRSIVDFLLMIRAVLRLRTSYLVVRTAQVHSTERVFWEIAIFLINILSILPLPQVAIWLIIPKMKGARELSTIKMFDYIVYYQLLPRMLRIIELYIETFGGLHSRLRFALCSQLFIIGAINVIGGVWYLASIRRLMVCWQAACASNASCNGETLNCSKYLGNETDTTGHSVLDIACPAYPEGRPPFDFGLYSNAIHSGILESTSLSSKLLYCFWWTLQNLSKSGQKVKTSTDPSEIGFALVISMGGGVFLALFIGIIQATVRSLIAREEEMMKWRDLEGWMDTHNFSPSLKDRVKQRMQYKWRKTEGLDAEKLWNKLPCPLKSDVQRHLSRNLLSKVPMFDELHKEILDALCDLMEIRNYKEGICIVREGDPVDKMLFIIGGEIQIATTDGGGNGSNHLKAGDFCGKELLPWALDPLFPSKLPSSSRTFQTLTEVEGFVIMSDDLKAACSRYFSRKLEENRRGGLAQLPLYKQPSADISEGSLMFENEIDSIATKEGSLMCENEIDSIATNEGSLVCEKEIDSIATNEGSLMCENEIFFRNKLAELCERRKSERRDSERQDSERHTLQD